MRYVVQRLKQQVVSSLPALNHFVSRDKFGNFDNFAGPHKADDVAAIVVMDQANASRKAHEEPNMRSER